jgi:hypothetical protein
MACCICVVASVATSMSVHATKTTTLQIYGMPKEKQSTIGMLQPHNRSITTTRFVLFLVFCIASFGMTSNQEASAAAIPGTATTYPMAGTSVPGVGGGDDNATVADLDCTINSGNPTTKTIFLVRHAESEENRRLGSLKSALKALTRFSLPKSTDIAAAMELIRVDQQIDSNVSTFGQQQIQYMANIIRQSNFISKRHIQLIAHSPLIRAKDTCRGMFGKVASNTVVADADPDIPLESSSIPSATHTCAATATNTTYDTLAVCELDTLKEMTPAEWLPGNAGSLHRRFRTLEDWIAQRPEHVIVLVGHSQFFKALLQLDYKFGNCDIMQVQFDTSTDPALQKGKWTNVQQVHLCRIPPEGCDTDS